MNVKERKVIEKKRGYIESTEWKRWRIRESNGGRDVEGE